MESNGNHEEKALAEDMQRVDLNPIEEARGIRRLIRIGILRMSAARRCLASIA